MMLKRVFFLAFLLQGALLAQQGDPDSLPEKNSYMKAYLYGTSHVLAAPPNGGITLRGKSGNLGFAADVSYSFLYVGDHFTLSGNMLGYLSKGPESLYTSLGLSHGLGRYPRFSDGWNVDINKVNTFSIPVRFGYESSYGFSDVGAVLFFSGKKLYAIPELRGGIGFTY